MDGAEGGPAVLLGVDDRPDGDQVVDVVEFLAAHDHLLVDRPEVLRPSGHLGLYPEVGETLFHQLKHLFELLATSGGPQGDHLGDLGKAFGMKGLERKIFELPLDLLDPETMGERGVDVPGLLCDPAPLPLRQRVDRPHVVEAVGELDDEDAPVPRHRHEHLAHRRRLLCFLRAETESVEFGHAVDDPGDIVAEFTLNLLELDPRVLHGIVQQGSDRARRVEAELRDDRRDGDRVAEVRLARHPVLTVMGPRSQAVGSLDKR